jgi:hypothetical protein
MSDITTAEISCLVIALILSAIGFYFGNKDK